MSMTMTILKDGVRLLRVQMESQTILMKETREALLSLNKEIKELKLMLKRRGKK